MLPLTFFVGYRLMKCIFRSKKSFETMLQVAVMKHKPENDCHWLNWYIKEKLFHRNRSPQNISNIISRLNNYLHIGFSSKKILFTFLYLYRCLGTSIDYV